MNNKIDELTKLFGPVCTRYIIGNNIEVYFEEVHDDYIYFRYKVNEEHSKIEVLMALFSIPSVVVANGEDMEPHDVIRYLLHWKTMVWIKR